MQQLFQPITQARRGDPDRLLALEAALEDELENGGQPRSVAAC